jgi:hypothetical protein
LATPDPGGSLTVRVRRPSAVLGVDVGLLAGSGIRWAGIRHRDRRVDGQAGGDVDEFAGAAGAAAVIPASALPSCASVSLVISAQNRSESVSPWM